MASLGDINPFDVYAMYSITKSRFQFVNLIHPDDLRDKEIQIRVRRIVMAEVGKARRKPKTRRQRNEIVLEIRDQTEAHLHLERFGGGQTDPFCFYPVEMNESNRELVAHIINRKSNHPIRMLDYWYSVGISCAATFHNLLFISQIFISSGRSKPLPSQKDVLALTHFGKALRAANEMLKDPLQDKSDEMIGTIASLMFHALPDGFANGHWYKHRDALVYIIGLRGGYETIKNESFQITLSWADLIGSFAQDIPPTIPMPARWKNDCMAFPDSLRTHSSASAAWKKRFPMQQEWITIFDDIVQFTTLDQAFNTERPLLSPTRSSWVEGILYRLLHVRPLQKGNTPGNIIEEVCRLGTLLFLTPVWRLVGQYTIRTAVISRKLLLELTQNMVQWNELKPLLVWVLYFAAIETKHSVEQRHLVMMLAVVIKAMHLHEWREVLSTLKNVLWVGKVHTSSDDLVRDRVMQIVNQECVGQPITVNTTPTRLKVAPVVFDRN